MDAVRQDARIARPAWRWRDFIRPALYCGGMVPAVWGFYFGFANQLGPDPIKALEHLLGLWALRFLIAGLAITPIRRLGGPSFLRYRRALGLLAFFYVCLHFAVYIGFDQGFDLAAIGKDILKRPYITIGMVAFVILMPLAATSNNAMVKRLGAAAWQRLHRWVYAAAALGALHFLLVVKSWPLEPMVYCAIVAGLLLFRLTPIGRNRRRRAAAATR
jgi:methionine sulfoxide reductase heme-binding subunit